MQLNDLGRQQRRIRDKIDANIKKVLDHGQYIMGPEVYELERKLAEYVGVKHAVACSSGTDALIMALVAVGFCEGDAVLTTPLTFAATANAISIIGGVPVFVDVDPDTFNMDASKLSEAIDKSKKKELFPSCIIPVNLFGVPCDYRKIVDIATAEIMFIIEDSAQSLGSTYHGEMAGALSDVGCASFFPSKPLGCYGDGGMCFTNNSETADDLRSVREHGRDDYKFEYLQVGMNSRLDTIQAAILLAKFELFQEEIIRRISVAMMYDVLLAGNKRLKIQHTPEGCTTVNAQYSLLAESTEHRDKIIVACKKAGIPTAIYYPKPLHLQKAFAYLGYKKGDFPVAEDISSRIFSLPMHPYLEAEEQQRIAEVVNAS